MRIATWNINGLRARLQFLQLWLEDRQPDIVGLQELKLEDDKFPHAELAELGYQAAVFGQKSWNGVAVLVRGGQPVDPGQVERGLREHADQGSRLITVRLDQAAQPELFRATELSAIEFTTVYCPNGKHTGHEDFPRKLAWYDSLVDHQTERPQGARVLCGDFNLCPGPLDTWSEELLQGGIFHTVEERSRFQALLDTGLSDLYRQVEPEGGQYSWWDYRAGAFHKNQGLRIDFLLGSGAVVDCVDAVWTDRDYRKKKDGLVASDHAPVIADLR